MWKKKTCGLMKMKKDMIQNTGTRQIGVQEINISDIVKPITKHAATIENPEDIDIHLNKSYNLMFDGRPGPVWLDIPLDVQSKIIRTRKKYKEDSYIDAENYLYQAKLMQEEQQKK